MNIYQGHEFVDLGLPSGTLWATCNVGAKKPEDCGDYFSWGETETKPIYDRDEYVFFESNVYKVDGSYRFLDHFTKYCEKDGQLILQSVDDAANVNWGGKWQMPSVADFIELIGNCRYSWEIRNNVEGSLYSASNGSSIFFPAGGYKFLGKFAEDKCFYWSRTMKTEDVFSAKILFNSKDSSEVSDMERKLGLPVRPICTAK